jgi:guanylate kinase
MIVTLTGPSCAGKSTLEKMLVKLGFSNAISTTTRKPRVGDVDGESYYFVDRQAFEDGIKAGAFVENVEFGGNYYGLAVAEVKRLKKIGKPIVVVCEPIGQKQIAAWCKANDYPLFAVFVDNPELVVSQRFLTRLADETWGMSSDDILKITDSYARRLKEMMTTERGWVAEAWASEIYNLRLSEFNEANGDEVAGIIKGVAFKEAQPQ